MTSCPHCGLQFSDPATPPSFCPSCGAKLEAGRTPSSGGIDLITDYFRRVWQILTRPKDFFRTMPVAGGVAGPLAFALITHWLGSAVSFLWRTLIGGAIGEYISSFMKMAGDVAEVDSPGRNALLLDMGEKLRHWIWGAGSVITDPFLTLIRIVFVSFLVFLGARILVTPGKNGAPREITFESTLRIICFGLTPSILAVLPIFGGFLSTIYVVIVTVIGVREVYKIETPRAVLVALFPQFLLLGTVSLGVIALMLVIFKLFATAF